MELHDSLRQLVDDHGRSMLEDAVGFRGVLDDVLEEDQASTGDINLLVDAVRFDVLTPLVAMIDGGADPARAVEESGVRLARERGGDDHAAASWASAVLGYAVGSVPGAVVLRYRSQRAPGTFLPPGTGRAAAPTPPATTHPPYQSPAPPPPSGPPGPQGPVQSPPATWAPYAGQPGQPSPQYGQPGGPPYAGGPGRPASFASAPRRKRTGLWVGTAVAGVVVVASGIVAAVALSGGDDDPGPSTRSDGPSTPSVDVSPEGIAKRYDALASKITAGTSDCTSAEPGTGQSEVIDCSISTGELRLVTYVDEEALTAARSNRLDYRAGTLSADNGSTALYEFDPERGGSSDPAVVYWDTKSSLQSAMLTGSGSAKVDTLVDLYKAMSPRVAQPTNPTNPVLREFIAINMDVSGCTRQRTFFKGETEESSCESGEDGVVVNVGRYQDRATMRTDRKYYKSQFEKGSQQGGGGTWRFGEGEAEGAYYAYLDAEGDTATIYWDWNKPGCYCYGVAWNFDGDLAKLEAWWPSDEE